VAGLSRVGRRPIPVPEGVQVEVAGNRVTVRGPRGKLEHALPPGIGLSVQGGTATVTRADEERRSRALHGLSRTLVANMVEGVTQGFSKSLDLVGTGYRAAKSGSKLVLTVGYSHPVEVVPPPGIEVEVPAVSNVVVRGIDKQLVGQVAADIRAVRRPSAYGEGKGIRYTGERVRTKEGKTGK
jgi:large subunit ribosomal protein L6